MREKKNKEYWELQRPNMEGALPEKGIISTRVLAYYLNVEETTIKRWIIEKGIPIATIGQKWLIKLADLPFEVVEKQEGVKKQEKGG